MLPDPVHHHPSGQVPRRPFREPTRQRQPTTPLRGQLDGPVGFEHFRDSARDHLSELVRVTTDLKPRVSRHSVTNGVGERGHGERAGFLEARDLAAKLPELALSQSSGLRQLDLRELKRLRRRIESDPSHPRYLLTVWGVGYKFADV